MLPLISLVNSGRQSYYSCRYYGPCAVVGVLFISGVVLLMLGLSVVWAQLDSFREVDWKEEVRKPGIEEGKEKRRNFLRGSAGVRLYVLVSLSLLVSGFVMIVSIDARANSRTFALGALLLLLGFGLMTRFMRS